MGGAREPRARGHGAHLLRAVRAPGGGQHGAHHPAFAQASLRAGQAVAAGEGPAAQGPRQLMALPIRGRGRAGHAGGRRLGPYPLRAARSSPILVIALARGASWTAGGSTTALRRVQHGCMPPRCARPSPRMDSETRWMSKAEAQEYMQQRVDAYGEDTKARIQAAMDARLEEYKKNLGEYEKKLRAERDAVIADCEAGVATTQEAKELLTLELADALVELSTHRCVLIPLHLLQVALLAKYPRDTMSSKEYAQKPGSHEKRFGRISTPGDLVDEDSGSPRRARRASPRSSDAQTWRPWPARCGACTTSSRIMHLHRRGHVASDRP
mmetsp:Transcript_15974/g.53702  ORF Transcript_15974/g.53702 Transcript_15974/m.53702 type:complete len:326 (-) Transcript_15974:150-1127(-)